MPRTIWTKLQSDPNGNWTRHTGEPPFSIPATGGLAYDVRTDTDETFVITPQVTGTAPSLAGLPTLSGTPQVGQALTAIPAAVTGTAPIATSWQWLRDGADIAGATEAVYVAISSDEGAVLSVRQTSTNAYGSDSGVSTGQTVQPAAGGSAVLSGLSVSEQDASGTVDVIYTISADSAVAGVVTTSATAPGAAQILAGLDHLGAPAPDSFTDTWTTSGSDTLPALADGLPSNTYYMHVLPVGGGDADVVSSNGFTMETVAPTIADAQTNAAGDEITLTLSETILGTQDTANWAVNGVSSGTPIIANVTISASTITLLIVGAPIAGTDTITLDYTPGDITDGVANALPGFTALPVTNNVPTTYTETVVSAAAGTSLLAPAAAGSGITSIFFAFSGLQQAGVDARTALVSFDSPSTGLIYADWAGGNGTAGLRATISAGGRAVGGVNTSTTPGTRYHALLSCFADGAGNLTLRASIREAGGTWVDAWADSVETGAGSTIDGISSVAMRLLQRIDGGGAHDWRGGIARMAMWVAADNTEIADPGDSAIQDAFIDSTTDQTVDPATLNGLIGTPVVDFHGPASSYSAGTHAGSLGTFTSSGTFS